jgi:hypothetical protein
MRSESRRHWERLFRGVGGKDAVASRAGNRAGSDNASNMRTLQHLCWVKRGPLLRGR